MKDHDNLTEISVEHKGKTIVEYWANSIPRVGEDIIYNDERCKVIGIIHKVTERKDSYVIAEVLRPYKVNQ